VRRSRTVKFAILFFIYREPRALSRMAPVGLSNLRLAAITRNAAFAKIRFLFPSSPAMPRIIVISDYDVEWQTEYHREATALQSALYGVVTACHHIGSTAVPGLAAKPIIDILMEVLDLDVLDLRTEALRRLGYEALGENGIPDRRFYQKGGDARTHHVHAFRTGGADIHRHLCFRDYLIEHPEDALAYAELKRRLAASFHNEPLRYVEEKAAFVRDLERRALHWKAVLQGGL